MSTLLWSLAKENPWPGLALASLNLVVALSLVGLSLLLGDYDIVACRAARVRLRRAVSGSRRKHFSARERAP